jgi:hypothetical protein
MKRFLQSVAKRIVHTFFASVHALILIGLIGGIAGMCLEATGMFVALSTFPAWNAVLIALGFYVALVLYTGHVKLAPEGQPMLVRIFAAKANNRVLTLIIGVILGKMFILTGLFAVLQGTTAWYVSVAILLVYATIVIHSNLIKFYQERQ